MSFLNSNGLDDLARRLADSVPESLRAFGRDWRAISKRCCKRNWQTRSGHPPRIRCAGRDSASALSLKLAELESRLKEIEAKVSPR
jgi:BMFP domain-containing protein YqiC